MKRKGFKVCYKPPKIENLTSTIFHSKHSLQYRIGEEVKPKEGLLFCFDTLENAILFWGGDNYGKIFECDLEQVPGPQRVIDMNYSCGFEDITNFWNAWNLHESPQNITTRTIPRGTIFATSVTLLREISKKEIEDAENLLRI